MTFRRRRWRWTIQRHPRFDRRYANLDPRVLPASESLKDTLARVLPFWNDRIAAELKAGKNVLVAAHGNSLRAMVKMLDNVSEADITELNIPTGVPLVYELDADLKPIKSGYLGDPEAIKAAAEAVKKQTEKKKVAQDAWAPAWPPSRRNARPAPSRYR